MRPEREEEKKAFVFVFLKFYEVYFSVSIAFSHSLLASLCIYISLEQAHSLTMAIDDDDNNSRGSVLRQSRGVQPFAKRLFGNDGNHSTAADNKPKSKEIAQWPFDDYHEVQTRYYRAVDQSKGIDGHNDHGNGDDSNNNRRTFVTRPPDMPDIPTAVQNLPLVDFEQKAEDRAIGIVSTWIFDAGLMDELLHGGGLTTHKMDKEIAKLKDQTERDLALINNRLNDGVAASGSEVQELVNAVQSTKADLARLRITTDEISRQNQQVPFLTHLPKLKTATNAKRNLQRCFKELDFFAQIPVVCSRLRETLTRCEWTEHEWTTLRDVGKEHVELQLFLVEAEAGMKARLREEEQKMQPQFLLNPGSADGRSSAMLQRGNSFRYAPAYNNHDSVDHFLKEHVQNVWEVGDEIRMRVLSGIGSVLDLSQSDPAGMVALVEAVEVYESAADEFQRVHGNRDDVLVSSPSSPPPPSLRNNRSHNSIIDMRRGALEQLAEVFEARVGDIFDSMKRKVIDEYKSSSSYDIDHQETAEFNAILRAANTITYKMKMVKEQMSPCFPPFWHIKQLWMTCVAAVCSKEILHQIGGQEGKKCESMTVTQLLDLVAWIELFREKVEDAFPDLLDPSTIRNLKRTTFLTLTELMKQTKNNTSNNGSSSNSINVNNKSGGLDLESAKENLQYMINVLWDVRTTAQDQFIFRTQQQTNGWLENVYNADHADIQTSEGHLTTSLPEDVWGLAGVQIRTIRERLNKKSTVMVDAFMMIFSAMQLKQRDCRNNFLVDLETSCAAANDFFRMTDECDLVVEELLQHTELSAESQQNVQDIANELLRQYTNDAVYAAQSVHRCIFEPIEEELKDTLFTEEWEGYAGGERQHAMVIVRTIEDYLVDITEWMEEAMVRKLVDSLVRASTHFYLKHLLLQAEKNYAQNSKGLFKHHDPCFKDRNKALENISGDIKAIRSYFDAATETFPALKRVVAKEFELLNTVFGLVYMARELADTAANKGEEGDDEDDMDSHTVHFLPLAKALGYNIHQTRLVIGDIYYIIGGPDREKKILDIFDQRAESFRALEIEGQNNNDGQFVMLDLSQYLQVEVYSNSTRKR